jgi:Zn-dependent peptidase ImmA (M78 family)/predicted transcriptional regulator
MEDIAKLIGQNIERLKKLKGLTNEDIGNIVGVTRVTVAKYLSGDQVIDSAKLYALSSKFNLPFEWFLKFNEEPMSFMFRAENPKENFDSELSEIYNNLLNSYIQILEMSEENNVSYIPQAYRIHLKEDKLLEDDYELIRDIAEKQRKAFGIEEIFDYDIYSILEKNNINVIAVKMDTTIDAFSAFSEEKGAFIIINDNPEIPEERKIFSTVHELGHLIFHRDDYTKKPDELAYSKSRRNVNEKIANTFASYFLIPRNQLRDYKKFFRGFVSSFSDINRIKKAFGVSASALMLALKEEGYIDQKNYGYLRKRLNELGFKETEPYPIDPIEKNERIKSILRRLYVERKISIDTVADLLLLNDRDLSSLKKSWDDENHGVNYELE